jgi:hypothetical protein
LSEPSLSGKLAPSELDLARRRIGAIDAEVDELVHELYDIKEEGRVIVEGALPPFSLLDRGPVQR